MIKLRIEVPKFDMQQWSSKVLRRTWEGNQIYLLKIGYETAKFMRDYLRDNRHRESIKTDPLENQLLVEVLNTTAGLSWGIGNIETLNNSGHAYWNIINYGAGYIPNNGNPIRGSFIPSGAPNSSLSGVGTEAFKMPGPFLMTPKTPIRTIPYIDATDIFLIRKLKDFGHKISGYGFKPFAGSD